MYKENWYIHQGSSVASNVNRLDNLSKKGIYCKLLSEITELKKYKTQDKKVQETASSRAPCGNKNPIAFISEPPKLEGVRYNHFFFFNLGSRVKILRRQNVISSAMPFCLPCG